MKAQTELLVHLRKQIRTDGRSVAEQIETSRVGPRLLGPAGQAEDEGHVRQLHGVENRQAAAFEINVYAVRERKKRFDEIEFSSSLGADDARLGVVVLRAMQTNHVFPRLEQDARILTGRKLVAQRARR